MKADIPSTEDATVVDYDLFLTKSGDTPGNFSSADATSLRSDILSSVAQLVVDYSWTYETFCLRVQDGSAGFHLSGSLDYKENVEDEWFLVSLLLRISEGFPELVIRVSDRDVGEILLVEAADVLPEWAQEPELMERRVFIHGGQVHLIPVAQNPSQLTPFPAAVGEGVSIETLARCVASYPGVTRASDAVQGCIRGRCGSYPRDWSAQTHYTSALLPPDVARLVAISPRLIAYSVQHLSEEVGAARAGDVKRIRPAAATEECHRVGVRTSRCTYAMLQSVKLRPRKKSGWVLPNQTDDDFEAAWNGYRICLGLDLMMRSLEKVSSFGCLSKFPLKFDALAEARIQQYKDLSCISGEEEVDQSLADLKLATEKCRSDDAAAQRLVEEQLLLPRVPDSDASWLHIKPDDFDKFLEKHFSVRKESATTMRNLAEFVSAESDMVGIEPPPDRPLDLDPEDFSQAMEKVLGYMKEYGDESDEEENLDVEAGIEELLKREVFSGMGEEERMLDSERNLVQSLEGQMDMTGPASTLLHSLPK